MTAPTTRYGSFETTLEMAPDDWPYALPHFYALNLVTTPGKVKLETVGYWQGQYKLIEVKVHPAVENAMKHQGELTPTIPIRYLMQDGRIVKENKDVQITGDWPAQWDFAQIRDIGVFLCYLWWLLKSQHRHEQARRLRASITPAWPPTELLLVFQESLLQAKQDFASDVATTKLINRALKTIKRWLKG